MKITFRLLALLVLSFQIIACSNSDSGKSSNPGGYVFFFNGLPGVSTIKLEGEDRNFGSVSYEEFGPGIFIESGAYDLDIIRPNDKDSSQNEDLLLNQSFTVTADDRTMIAVTGTASEPKFHEVVVAEVPTEDEFEDALDDGAVFLNVTHASDLNNAELSVYFLEDGEVAGVVEPAVVLNYGETSDRLQLTGDETSMQIYVGSDTSTAIFDSGEQTLRASNAFGLQTILVTDYVEVDGDDAVSAYYFYAAGTEVWRESSSEAYVKVVNLIDGETITATAKDVLDVNNVNLAVSLGFSGVSDYVAIDTSVADYLLGLDITSNTFLFPALGGSAQTFYLFDIAKASVVIQDPKVTADDRASVQVVNMSYSVKEDDSDVITDDVFNFHLIKSGTPSSNTADLEGVQFTSYGTIEITDFADYVLYATNEDNDVVYTSLPLTLSAGDSFQVIIHDTSLNADQFAFKDVTKDIP